MRIKQSTSISDGRRRYLVAFVLAAAAALADEEDGGDECARDPADGHKTAPVEARRAAARRSGFLQDDVIFFELERHEDSDRSGHQDRWNTRQYVSKYVKLSKSFKCFNGDLVEYNEAAKLISVSKPMASAPPSRHGGCCIIDQLLVNWKYDCTLLNC